MAESKKYYWLKLKEDFFKDKEIKKLRKIAGGDTYTIIYLKLMLLGLKDEGKLFFEGIEDSFAEELALELDEETENVKVTLLYLVKMGLLQEVNDKELFLSRLPECVGKETAKAELMRKKRSRDKSEKIEGGNNVTPMLPPVTFCYTEKEKEKEEDIDTEIETEKEEEQEESHSEKPNTNDKPFALIVEYLNSKANTKYRCSTKATQNHINARLKEGFTVEDFKVVIDKKCSQWLNNPKMCGFLRPETLFGTKFESYLNEIITVAQPIPKGEEIQIINGKEYICKNGRYFVPNGSGIEVNPFAEDDLPY